MCGTAVPSCRFGKVERHSAVPSKQVDHFTPRSQPFLEKPVYFYMDTPSDVAWDAPVVFAVCVY